ncbi:MAG: beta-ketoacyl-ACP synthase [Alphaproteobacteria bacterium]|nr:beta-ketoacyl-ACP synthase [Alphaproteobacteria bacterium]
MASGREAWITGIGLVSSLGDGAVDHGLSLRRVGGNPVVECESFSPNCVHPLVAFDVASQIHSKNDLRQMGRWQQIGVYAAGLALADADVAGRKELLDRIDIVAAAGNGERDPELDMRILENRRIWDAEEDAIGPAINDALQTGLRPTLYLGELSNLLAGNIQIVHKVTGSSRTLKGEEMAGVSAVENAVRRIAAGQADIVLAGGALNAERQDLLLGYELGCNLWAHPYQPVWQRMEAGSGGVIPGSVGVFLVIEAREHALARGARGYAVVQSVASGRARRSQPGEIRDSLESLFDTLSQGLATGPLAVLSGASGVARATAEELAFLDSLDERHFAPVIRAYGSRLGHAVEAHFPLGIALAALALSQGRFFPPFDDAGDIEVESGEVGPLERVMVTGVGHWRGEGIAAVERIPAGRVG